VTLYTHLVVREDAHLLFGFSRESQRRLFRDLLKVNGVGPRVALAILSGMSDQEFVACVAQSDIARLTRIPGIGRKTAERLVVELRDRLPDMEALVAAGGGAQAGGAHSATGTASVADPVSEAVSALIALGYKPQEASRAVRNIASKDASAEDIIRQALRSMAG
jgi:Holliday junction DNA helicase RuvA